MTYGTGACTLATAFALLAAAADSKAGAFALYEQGVSGLGNAYAGAAAVAEDASTVWWNPAGMAWLPKGKHFAFAVAFANPSTTFTDKGSVAAAGRPLGNTGGDPSTSATLPSGFFAMDLTERLSIGFGFGVPFGLKTEYDPAWLGRFQGISSEIKTVNFNPSVSYRFGNMSVGGGINYTTGEINLLSAVNLGAAEAQNRTNVDGDAWSFNLGAQANLGADTRLGVHYRSSAKFKTEGDTTFTAPAPQSLNGRVKLDVETPDHLAFSVAHRMNALQLLADATWWHWSKVDQLPLIRTDGPSAGATLDTLVLHLQNAWRTSAGTNYKVSEPLTLKLGVAYDKTPVRDAQQRTVRLPDNDRYWISAGVKYLPWKNGVLDVGYTFIKAKDADIANNQATNRGIVRGTYEATVHLFGLQYQQTF